MRESAVASSRLSTALWKEGGGVVADLGTGIGGQAGDRGRPDSEPKVKLRRSSVSESSASGGDTRVKGVEDARDPDDCVSATAPGNRRSSART